MEFENLLSNLEQIEESNIFTYTVKNRISASGELKNINQTLNLPFVCLEQMANAPKNINSELNSSKTVSACNYFGNISYYSFIC
jgi:hypothetical protein